MGCRSPSRSAPAAANAAFWALLFGAFCVRSTKIYFSMLTLAFAQIVWAVCFKWNSVTGGEQGFNNIRILTSTGWRRCRCSATCAPANKYYLRVLLLTAIAFAALWRVVGSPFGRVLDRDPREPGGAPSSCGVNVRRYQLAAFVTAGAFAGFAGALFGTSTAGVFPDFAYWAKSAEVLIMADPRRHGAFLGTGCRRRGADPAQPADHRPHAILAVRPRHRS
jgi:branched-chain amino acid transport system permease protein